MRLCVHSASFIVCYLCICWSLDSQPLVLALKHLHDGNKVFRLIPLCIHLCFLPTKMEVSWADYYVLMYKKQELHPFPALSPCLPPSLLSSLASSAVWSMGPGQVAKHVQPSLPPPPSSSLLLHPPPPFSSPIQTASCSAVPLAAGSSQVRCSTRATTCSLLTAVYRRGTVQTPSAERFHCEGSDPGRWAGAAWDRIYGAKSL